MNVFKGITAGILITMASGLILATVGVYNDVRANTGKVKGLEKQVDELHWFLIRRNDIKVPRKGK